MDLLAAIASNRSLAARTKQLYTECVTRFLRFAIPRAGRDPAKYTCSLVEDWFDDLGKKGLQPQTVGIYRKAIRMASRRLAQLAGDPKLDFAAAATCIKAPARTPRVPLTYDEAARILATCGRDLAGQRDRVLIVTALRTGLRRGGLLALQISGVRPPQITTLNKGGSMITLTADQETLAGLASWIRVLRAHGITSGPVFQRIANGRPAGAMTPYEVWAVFARRAKLAGIKRPVFPHLARHSTVTWLREAGMTAAEVSQLTGQTERTIEDIYTHVRTVGPVSAALPSLTQGRTTSRRRDE